MKKLHHSVGFCECLLQDNEFKPTSMIGRRYIMFLACTGTKCGAKRENIFCGAASVFHAWVKLPEEEKSKRGSI